MVSRNLRRVAPFNLRDAPMWGRTGQAVLAFKLGGRDSAATSIGITAIMMSIVAHLLLQKILFILILWLLALNHITR